MTEAAQHQAQDYWIHTARRLMRRLNAAWWGSYFVPGFLTASIILSVGILISRRNAFSLLPLGTLYAASLALFALGAWLFARKHFCSERDAFARLDQQLQLYNQLSTAKEGVGAWPEPEPVFLKVALDKRRLLIPVVAATMLLPASICIPVARESNSAPSPVEQPLAWQQVEQAIARLEQTETFDSQVLSELREQLQSLQRQNKDKWFEQSSLEAGESLKENIATAVTKNQSALEALSEALDRMQSGTASTGSELKALQSKMDSAVERLKESPAPPNDALLRDLERFTQSDLDKLTPEQRTEMKERVARGESILDQAADELNSTGSDQNAPGESQGQQPESGGDQRRAQSDLNRSNGARKGKQGDGQSADKGEAQDSGTSSTDGQSGQGREAAGQPGAGGISRGPGTAPLELNPRGQAVEPQTLKRITPADKTAFDQPFTTTLSKQSPRVDQSRPFTLDSGSAPAASGSGGEAVWKYSTSPKEREVLQKLFK